MEFDFNLNENEDVGMSTIEISRLIDWLREKGHTDTEILDCIKFIANEPEEDDE